MPIVFVSVTDPVGLRLVSSLARPGGNITGLAISSADLAGKRLELLRELVPKVSAISAILPDKSSWSRSASLSAELIGKRVELMKELLPGLARVAVFLFPATPARGRR